MKIAYFEPVSGASGDMILGALIDAGVPIDHIRDQLDRLPLKGFTITANVSRDGVVAGTKVEVEAEEQQPHRTWHSIRELLQSSSLDDTTKNRALRIFSALATAEAIAHGVDEEDVHFHEVGAVDSIVDIVGAAIGFTWLGIDDIYSGPVRTGYGMTSSQHGMIPAPAPATIALLESSNAPIMPMPAESLQVVGELLTPTGAAILTALGTFSRPAFTTQKIAAGFGTKSLPWPNALRMWIGESEPDSLDQPNPLFEIETNIDDMNPQAFELLAERLFDAGARDVWLTPIQMKKQRPGTKISLLVDERNRSACEELLLTQSTTFGVRRHPVDRTTADRHFQSVITRFGEITVKLKIWEGRVIDVVPEYDDCAAVSRNAEVPLHEIVNEARRLAEPMIGIDASTLDQS